ncbi:protein SYS1 homolog [Episyrphus balteatus]|uniref:protein SYS1 homolog n=1 Tax=Episyrphus balteatus TaxID=286459 RepID=UPI0024850A31|nr:protein SYS1 homolog [Episyrphus balteatus]
MKYGRFRIGQWDLLLIFGQILSMQFFTYSLLGLVLLLVSYVLDENLAVSSFFRYDVLWLSKIHGRIIFFVFLTTSVLSTLLLWVVVKRAKLCLDFSSTFHGFHLLICWWYNSSFPTHLSWWLLNIITSAIMCIGGEVLCLKSELKKIPVGYNNRKCDV